MSTGEEMRGSTWWGMRVSMRETLENSWEMWGSI